MRVIAGVAFAAALAASSSQALADTVEVGFLECRGQSMAFVVGSITKLECLFRPSVGGRPQAYYGTIRRAGLDIGWNDSTVVKWAVYAPTDRLGATVLAGGYAGGSASVTVGYGVGANALFGGSNSTISLQPLSVQGQTGLSAAAGVAALELVPARGGNRGPRKHRGHRG